MAYKVAEDNLRIGGAVVADSVNPIEQTRAAWRRIAEQCDAPFVEIEVVCSDTAVHKRRVETRRADIPNQELPTWRAVQQRQVEPWNSATVVLDTAHRTVFESLAELEYHLKARKIG